MNTLKAEKRDTSIKTKKLKRLGFVPGNVYGKELKENISLQIKEANAKRFIKTTSKGHETTLEVGTEKIDVIVKDYTYNSLKGQIENIDFQQLVMGETIKSTAHINLLNQHKIEGHMIQSLDEINYKALPTDLVETIDIDVANLETNTTLTVGDLDLVNNKNVTILSPLDAVVLTISDHFKTDDLDDLDTTTVATDVPTVGETKTVE